MRKGLKGLGSCGRLALWLDIWHSGFWSRLLKVGCLGGYIGVQCIGVSKEDTRSSDYGSCG